MQYKRTKEDTQFIKMLELDNEKLKLKINGFLKGELTNDIISIINSLRLKISFNEIKIDNIKEGRPQNGYGELLDSFSVSNSPFSSED